MKHTASDKQPTRLTNERATERQVLTVPARLTWKDQRGTTCFASVVTRDVSEYGVYVECQSAVSISLYRLVQFQVEPGMRDVGSLPESLCQGRILSAVYRVSPTTKTGKPQGLALRLMVNPKRRRPAAVGEPARATA